MKHLFKILFVLIFFSLINLGYAASPGPGSQRMHFTVKNDYSHAPLTLRSTYPTSLAGSLPNKIPANSSSGRVAYTFNKPTSKLSISYGFSSGNYCTFSCTGSCFAATATPSSDLVTCSKGPHNIMHVGVVWPYKPGANCLRPSAWLVHSHTNLTCAWGKITCNLGQKRTGAYGGCNYPCGIVPIQIHADADDHWGQLSYICMSKYDCAWPLPRYGRQNECANMVNGDTYLTKYYGN